MRPLGRTVEGIRMEVAGGWEEEIERHSVKGCDK